MTAPAVKELPHAGVVKPECNCGKPPLGVSHDLRCPAHDAADCRACAVIASRPVRLGGAK